MRRQVWLLAAAPLLAQDSIGLSLREAIERALTTHPAVAGAAERVSASKGAQLQAGYSPNPRLVLQSENTRTYGRPGFQFWRDTDNFAYLLNTFETAGKRQQRVESATVGVRRAEMEVELLKSTISGNVARAYWTAAGARRVYEHLLAGNENLKRIVDYHEVRVREGAMAEADLIRVRLEAQRMAIAANHALLESERGRIHLLREMGQSEFPGVRFTDGVDDPAPSPPSEGVESALAERPVMKLARLGVEQARAQHRVQQANAQPNLDVLFGYKRTGGFDTMMGGVQLELPFRNRNQGGIAAAWAEIRQAEAALAATEALVRAEVQAARSDYEIRQREIAASLEPLLRQAEETYQIAEAAYREGGADLLRLLDAQRVRIEAQITYARGLAEFRQSLAELANVLGETPR